MGNILDRIISDKRKEVEVCKKWVSHHEMQCRSLTAPPPRDFFTAVTAPTPRGIHLIAEIKRQSPSAGLIREDFDPVAIAQVYHEAGASAISVLTDGRYFGGRIEHIQQVRDAVPLPVLRKDFVVDAYQVHEARAAGADAVLLIAEVLGAQECERLAHLCKAMKMTALVEAYHPELIEEVLRAFGKRVPRNVLIGINNRDLTMQQTDLSTTERLAARMADTSMLVSESGIKTRADVLRVQRAGARAMLVGETIMAAENIGGKIGELLGSTDQFNS